MKKKYDYDLIAIGGGGAGITAVTLAHGLGKRAALVDVKKFGGECTWSGCVPSKALLHIADTVNMSNVANPGSKPDTRRRNRVFQEVAAVIKYVYSNETPEHFKKSGIAAFENTRAVFTDPHTIRLNDKPVTSSMFIITTGSRPAVPPVEGLEKIKYYTNENIFSLSRLPVSMAVLGGGPIGIELASAFNRLGVNVSVVEMAPGILPREDSECSTLLADILRSEGVKIITGARVVRIDKKGTGSIILYEQKNGRKEKINAEIVLIAAGRKPNVEGLGLKQAGVRLGSTGIIVSKTMLTSVNNIYAAGDVTGPFQFSHVANYQAILAVSNAFIPFKKKADYRNIPWCTFTDPELARSGLTEKEAAERYKNHIRIYRVPYSNIDRAKTDVATNGLAKFICTKKGRILGIHILGKRAGEIIHEVHAAKTLGVPLHRLSSVIHIYPTYSEIVRLAARDAYIDRIKNNPVVKLIGWLRSFK
ncbi:MAG: NAD(P)/FAD-dependent oxidoreductase [Spirochaetota bacterium]